MATLTTAIGQQADGSGARGEARVDTRLPTPLYHQIHIILRERIATGHYGEGEIIPSEAELAKEFGVSRITVKRAVNRLAEDGLVDRARGRGTTVAAPGLATPPVTGSIEGLLENLLAMGVETEVRLLDFGYEPAPESAARAMGIDAGTPVQKAVRVRRLDGAPLSHLVTYVPEDVGRSYERADLENVPLLALLERFGVVVTEAEQTITATLADPAMAEALSVEIGSPLLQVARVVYDQNGRAVEYIRATYRPDRYRYTMRLSRVHGEGRSLWSPAG